MDNKKPIKIKSNVFYNICKNADRKKNTIEIKSNSFYNILLSNTQKITMIKDFKNTNINYPQNNSLCENNQ